MKILILGGTSFFGKETAELLFSKGNEVTVFSRRVPVEGLPLDIKQARGERALEIDLSRMATQTWDAVIDNICFSAEDARKAVRVFSGRTGLYIFTSSASVYAVLEGASSPYREAQAQLLPQKTELKEKYAYAAGKYEAERGFLAAFAENSFPAVVVRPPVVIGPNDHTLRAYSYWLRLADGGPLFLPGAAFSSRYIFSKDLARAFETLVYARSAAGQAFNFGDSLAVTLEDLLRLSARILHREPKLLYPQYSWLKQNGFNFDASPFSYGGNFVLDITKAEKELNWVSSPMDKWLEETINWFLFKYFGPQPKNYAARKSELELAEKWRREAPR